MSLHGLSADSEFLDLVEELTDRCTEDSPSQLRAFINRFPQHRERLTELLPSLMTLRSLQNDDAKDRSGNALRAANAQPGEPTVIGDFRLIRELGRGGMGVVYEAEQLSLPRRVALKVLPHEVYADTARLQRFRNEALAAASLEHPNIVRVYCSAFHEGVHHIAMQYVAGDNLATWMAHQRAAGVWPHSAKSGGSAGRRSAASHRVPGGHERWVAEVGRQIADALHHAHTEGVIHRDVKPSNLIRDHSGTVRITDFGLALTRSGPALTRTGHLIGTLRYMSPEQAAGRRTAVDHRTDIYGLGATLFELLAGEPLFPAEEQSELLRQILDHRPATLTQRHVRVTADLETIVMKAVATEPEERYATAADLRDDLTAFLERRRIQARRPTRADRFRKWCRRHQRRLFALAAAGVMMLTLTAFALLMIGHERSLRRLEQARQEDQRAVIAAQREDARNHQYVVSLHLAHKAWQACDWAAAREHLRKCIPQSGETDLRDFAWFRMQQLLNSLPLPLGRHNDDAYCVAVTPDGSVAATTGPDGIRLWDLRTWRPVRHLTHHEGDVNSVWFSADGRRMVSASDDGTVGIWSTSTWEVIQAVECGDWVVAAELRHGGRHLLAATRRDGPDGRTSHIHLLDPETNSVLWTRRERGGHIHALSTCRDSPAAAVAVEDGIVSRLNLRSGALSMEHHAPHGDIRAVAIDRTDTWLAAACGQDILVWQLDAFDSPPVLRLEGHRELVEALRFTGSGQLVSAGRDGLAVLWHIDWKSQTPRLKTWRRFQHNTSLWCATLTPDESQLLTTDREGCIRSWPLTRSSAQEPDVFRRDGIEQLSVDDKRRIAACDYRCDLTSDGRFGWFTLPANRVVVWDLERDRRCRLNPFEALDEPPRDFLRVDISPDDRSVCFQVNGHARLYDIAAAEWAADGLIPGDSSRFVTWAPGGRDAVLKSDHSDHLVFVNPDTGVSRTLVTGASWLGLSADGRVAVTARRDGVVTVRDPEDWNEVRRFVASQQFYASQALSPDGRVLATVDGASIALWNVAACRRYPDLTDSGYSLQRVALRFSNDGSLLGAEWGSDSDSGLFIWDVSSAPGGSRRGTDLLTRYR